METAAKFFNAITDLIIALSRLLEATSPIGPFVFVFFPSIVCLFCLRIGYAILAAIFSMTGLALLSMGLMWGGLILLIAWIIPFFAVGSRRRALQIRTLEKALRDQNRPHTTAERPGQTSGQM